MLYSSQCDVSRTYSTVKVEIFIRETTAGRVRSINYKYFAMCFKYVTFIVFTSYDIIVMDINLFFNLFYNTPVRRTHETSNVSIIARWRTS